MTGTVSTSLAGIRNACGSTQFYTLKDLAALLGITRQAVSKKAKIESWSAGPSKAGLGGRAIVYAYADLSSHVQRQIDRAETAASEAAEMARLGAEKARDAAIAAEKLGADVNEAARRAEQARLDRLLEGQKKFASLPKECDKRKRAEARRWVLACCAQHHRDIGGSLELARTDLCIQLLSGARELPEWVSEWMPTRDGHISLSEVTLKRWAAEFSRSGLWGLVDGYGNRAGDNKIARNPALYRLVLGAMVKAPHINPCRIKDFLQAKHPELNVVSERGIARFMSAWRQDHPQLWTYITNPDQWKNIYMAAAGSMFEHITELNQLWELDSTPGDWLLKDGRHTVVGAIDMYSRRLKFFVSKTSTAAAVKQLMRRCMLAWGIPKGIRTDNGADYVSHEVDSFLVNLSIAHEICIPFASEQKGTIERAMRTMSHGLLELLPGFAGHNVAEAQAIRARKAFADRVMQRGELVEAAMTAAELQQTLDSWSDNVYAKDAHSGLGGRSPWEVANAWQGPIYKVTDEHALDQLLAEIGGTRSITKKGVRYEGRTYIDPTGAMYEHVGAKATLRLDEQDIGRLAVYLDGNFLCWALDPDARGINRREAASAIKHHQKAAMREQAAELKQLSKELKENIVDTVIDYRREQAGKVHELPKKTLPYVTAGLREAARAVTDQTSGSRAPKQAPASPRAQKILSDLRAGTYTSPVVRSAAPTAADDQARWFARADRIEAAMAAHEPVTELDRAWHAKFIQLPIYLARQRMRGPKAAAQG